MANCRGVAECWSQPNSKHSNVNVVRPSWPCESDARTYKLAPPDGGSGSAGSLKEGSLPGTYPGAAGRAPGALLAGGIERARARPRPQTCDTLGCIACHRWARLGCAGSTLAYAQRMQG